jgi:hypothetical protein
MELPDDVAAAIDALLNNLMEDERRSYRGEADHVYRSVVTVARWRGWTDLLDPDDPNFLALTRWWAGVDRPAAPQIIGTRR